MSGAWVLDIGAGLRAAVGESHQVHLMVEAPDVFELPLTPQHARHALLWNDECVPVLDLGAWLTAGQVATQRRYLGIHAYPGQEPRSVHYGGLWIEQPPQRRRVDDRMAADLPAHPPFWAPLVCSCFTDAAGAVPILDLARVFAQAPARTVGMP